jgi:hypothetical protein
MKLINQTYYVHAKVVRLGEFAHSDITCKDLATGENFVLDPFVGAKNEKVFKLGDEFQAKVHPCQVVFAVQDWIDL